MTRTSPVLLLALAAAAPGCGHKADPVASEVKAVASAVASEVKSAVDPPPNHYVPASTPLTQHASVAVHLPGDKGAPGAHKAKHVPNQGSPVPHATESAELPKSHVGDGKPWECIDKEECYFPRMPFYSQTNQNLAHIKMPKASYDADTSKLTGPIVWDADTKSYALVLDPSGAKTKDPFYNTWLPYGPVSDKDEGYLGWWMSNLCGATAEAMAVMAAWFAKSPTTKTKPGSWMETAMVEAKKPDDQAALPNPLLVDHTTLAPGNRQMTDKDLQRLVNMAIKEGTSPVSGGANTVMTHLGDDFELVSGKAPVQSRYDEGKPVTNKVLMDDVRERFAPTLLVGEYKASLQPVKQGDKIVKYTLTFTPNGGHFLAVNGFRAKGRKRAALLIYDPVYSNPCDKTIAEVPLTGATKDGVPIEVTTPISHDPKHLPILEDLGAGAPKAINTAADITDGQDVTMVGGYAAIKID